MHHTMKEKQTTTVFATKEDLAHTKVDMVIWIVIPGVVEMAAIIGLYFKS